MIGNGNVCFSISTLDSMESDLCETIAAGYGRVRVVMTTANVLSGV